MEIGLWFLVVLLAVGFAYTLQFSCATLAMGRELSGSTTTTGFQDAITPPWQTNLTLAVYIAIAVVVVFAWWQLWWVSALGVLGVILIGSSLAKLALPKPSGRHYRGLILRSMIARYANYVRDGDTVRADAMKQLLTRAGIDPDSSTTSTTFDRARSTEFSSKRG